MLEKVIQNKLITKLSIFIMGILIIAQLYVANQLSTSGVELSQLQEQTQVLSQQVQQLEQQIIKQKSISQLNQQSEKFYLQAPKQVITVKPASELAQNR